MFKGVTEKFNSKQKAKADRELLLEAVMGDDFGTEAMPMSSEEEEAVADVGSIPNKALNKAYDDLDKIIEGDDFDDAEIEELLDGMDDELGEYEEGEEE